jgi:prolipoprotein diacylglyceryltransferase
MVLGGAGQGRFFEGDWATAFLGAGPWVSAAAAVPSHPSQVYEALGTTVAALLILMASSLGAFRSRDATRLLVAIALWCLVRAAVATTWRDPVVAGPLPMGGVIALVIAAGALAGAIVEGAWLPRRSRATRAAAQPAWPDPETRPPF